MNDRIDSDLNPHEEAEELLPWYVTGQLGAAEQALVDQHVASCAHCRRELAFDRRMVEEFAALTPEVDTGWARLRQRIDSPRKRWGWLGEEAAAAWRTFTRPSVAAFALTQLLFVIVAGSFLFSLSRPEYRALGSAPAPQSANAIVMFRADTTEGQLRTLLQGNGATLIGGPTAADAYLVHVPAQSRETILQHLRSSTHVEMAQPIDGSAS